MIDGITLSRYPHYHMDCDLQTITQHLLQSYEEIGGINHFDYQTWLVPAKEIFAFESGYLRMLTT